MDFVHDRTMAGLRRALIVVDECTREAPVLAVARSMPSSASLGGSSGGAGTGCPRGSWSITGPSSRRSHGTVGAIGHGVALHFIEPGKPTQNAYIESFDGGFETNASTTPVFSNVQEAQTTLEQLERYFDERSGPTSRSEVGNCPTSFARRTHSMRGRTLEANQSQLRTRVLRMSVDVSRGAALVSQCPVNNYVRARIANAGCSECGTRWESLTITYGRRTAL